MEEIPQILADWRECYLLKTGKGFRNRSARISGSDFFLSVICAVPYFECSPGQGFQDRFH